MTDLLLRLFMRKSCNDVDLRVKYGNFASVVGIVTNLVLCLLKGIFGIIFSSVAMVADAVNNFSDAGNSIITLIGFVLSGKPADEDHPYGHARVEYVSCMSVAFIIMFFGILLLKSSFGKIINPQPMDVNCLTITVLLVSIFLKLWLSLFYRNVGTRIQSDVLFANSRDSLNDVISTSAVLLSALVTLFYDVNLDGYAGVLVSIFVIYTGVDIFRNTIDNLLGKTPDKKFIADITDKILSYEGVFGIHDLVIHNYGPDKLFATVHVEVSAHGDILASHDLIDNIERDFAKNMNINMVIHLDPVITDDALTNELMKKVNEIIKHIDPCISMHDFRMVKGETHSNLIFDVLLPDSCKLSDKQLVCVIEEQVKKIDDNLFTVITVDRNYISNKH